MGYIGFDNDTLGKCHNLQEGQKVICPNCNKLHTVDCGTDMKTGKKSNLIMAIMCPKNDECYLVGIAGKFIAGSEPDVSR